jgi:hypothetical protein
MHVASMLLLSGSCRKSEGQVGFAKSTYIFQKEIWLDSENYISCISLSAYIYKYIVQYEIRITEFGEVQVLNL